MLKPEQIPRLQEMLLHTELLDLFMRLGKQRYADRPREMSTMRLIGYYELRGKPLNRTQLARLTGIKPSTMQRLLDGLIRKGRVERDGMRYYRADHLVLQSGEPGGVLDQLNRAVCETADAVRAIKAKKRLRKAKRPALDRRAALKRHKKSG